MTRMLRRVSLISMVVVFLLVGMNPGVRELRGEVNCLTCHEALSKEKVVHPALQMGCQACHSGIDAAEIPHKKTNNIAKGLSSEPPQLCYGCHDKKKFEGKTVHSPVAGGMCTTCHNPHSSKNPKLLVAEAPDLCFNCHDKAEFSRKNVHAPVQGGMCLQCHASIHASNEPALLKKKINAVCIECHANIVKAPHPVRGVKKDGHPLQGKKDPVRKDKPFSCASCHNPHSSDSPKLFRYAATAKMDLCTHCHNY